MLFHRQHVHIINFLLSFQVLHDSIQRHQQPILEAAQDVESLIKQFPKRIDQPTQNNLRSLANDLKSRYNVVNYQSTNRTTKLASQADELQKFSEDVTDFEQWLNKAEKTQADVQKNIGHDINALKRQNSDQKKHNEDIINHVAELRFVNVTGQKFLDAAKVILLTSTDHFVYIVITTVQFYLIQDPTF